jgi:ribosomal protein L16/L10AE
LGEEAFTDKRGTDAEIYIRKGKSMLEIRTSAGSEVARKAAEIATAKLP